MSARDDAEFERYRIPFVPVSAPTPDALARALQLPADGEVGALAGPILYRYDPTPATGLLAGEPGVTNGYLVLTDGEPQVGAPVQVARAAILHDPDGTAHVEVTGPFELGTVVDG